MVWHKFAKYWDVEMREVPMRADHYGMDAQDMLDRVDENTIVVVPTFGVTYTGAYEPVQALSDALDRLQAETGLDIDIHVDGASGAFLAPFCAPRCSSTSGCPGSSRSAPRATSSAWPRSAWAGWCGGTKPSCPTTSSST